MFPYQLLASALDTDINQQSDKTHHFHYNLEKAECNNLMKPYFIYNKTTLILHTNYSGPVAQRVKRQTRPQVRNPADS